MASINGVVDSRFENLGRSFGELLTSGKEVGSSIAATYQGELVVDAWGGHADPLATTPWSQSSLTNVFSSGKTVIALSALLLVDQGLLDVDRPVASYWPAFAANGKGDVLVRHLMSHTSGLMGWDAPFTYSDLYDWEKATATLASQRPWFEPGTRSGYHMMSYGYLVGEVVRRVSGHTPNAFLQSEVPELLNGDFYFGLPESERPRYAPFLQPEMRFSGWLRAVAGSSVGRKALGLQIKTIMSPPPDPVAAHAADTGIDVPIQAYGNARGLARIQSVIANHGEVGGKRYLRDATIEKIFHVQSDGRDAFFRKPLTWGIGYSLARPGTNEDLGGRVAFWQGFGGSRIVAAVDQGCTFSYVMNKGMPGLLGDERGDALLQALARDLAALTKGQPGG